MMPGLTMSLNSAVAGLSPPSTCSNDDNRGYDQTWNYDGWDEIFQVRITVRIAPGALQEAREICHKQSPFGFTVPLDLEQLRTAPPSSAANLRRCSSGTLVLGGPLALGIPRHRIQAVGGTFRADDHYGQRDSAAGSEFMARRRSHLRGSALPARQRQCRLTPPSTKSIRNSECRLQGRLESPRRTDFWPSRPLPRSAPAVSAFAVSSRAR